MTTNGNGFHFTATPAARTRIFARFGLCGAGGSGKSYSALAIASALRDKLGCGPLFVVDSENGSALRYARSTKTGRGFDFMHVPMNPEDYSPKAYMAALDFCEDKRAGVVLVDSISHEYDGPGGVLEIVDNNTQGRDGFSGWRVATPQHKRFLQRLNSVEAHIIWTVRAKMAYEMRDDPKRPGKQSFQKVGLGPVQREGIEYEPDIFGWMNDQTLTVDKTRCDRIEPMATFARPGADVAALLADWIEDVAPAANAIVPTPLDRAKVGTASAADVALLLADPSGNVRVHGWMCAIRTAPLGELDAITTQLASEPAPKLKRDMLDAIAKRKAAADPAQPTDTVPQ